MWVIKGRIEDRSDLDRQSGALPFGPCHDQRCLRPGDPELPADSAVEPDSGAMKVGLGGQHDSAYRTAELRTPPTAALDMGEPSTAIFTVLY